MGSATAKSAKVANKKSASSKAAAAKDGKKANKIKNQIKEQVAQLSKDEPVDDNEVENSEEEAVGVEDFFNSQVNGESSSDEADKKATKKIKKAKKAAKKLANEKEDYKESIENLAEKDPEFYKFLKENDQGLLDIALSSDGEDNDEEEEAPEEAPEDEEEEEDVPQPKKAAKEESGDRELTMATINAWKKSLQTTHSIKTIRKVLIAFKGAVRASESDDANASVYTLTNPEVFNSLLFLTLKVIPEAIQHNIPLAETATGSKYVSAENKRFKTLSGSLKAHAASLAVLLEDLQDKDIANLVLKSIHTLLPYFLSFRKQLKELVDAVVTLWSTATEDDTKIVAFAFLKAAAEEHSKSVLEIILKSTYSGILKNSRRTNIHTMPSLNFQKNSGATLYAIDPLLSYQISFQFIRQLAIHLRSSLVNKTPEAYKAIYNWQYANSLDFWSRTLCVQCNTSNPEPSPLKELIYPLVQITLGAIRLVPTPQYFPLRFYLIRSLLRLSQATGTYIPVLPLLTEILSSTVITKSPKASTLKALDFEHNIRATKSYIGTRVFQDGVCEELVDLIGEFFVLHATSPAFPELAVPAVITLKRFIKRSKNAKFNRQIQRLVERLDAHGQFVQKARSEQLSNAAPTDSDKVAAFMATTKWEETPLGTYVVVQRQIREERARILRESLEADAADARTGGARSAGSDGEIGMSDLEDDKQEDASDSDEEMSDA
jgi:nucleolar complex protein 2